VEHPSGKPASQSAGTECFGDAPALYAHEVFALAKPSCDTEQKSTKPVTGLQVDDPAAMLQAELEKPQNLVTRNTNDSTRFATGGYGIV